MPEHRAQAELTLLEEVAIAAASEIDLGRLATLALESLHRHAGMKSGSVHRVGDGGTAPRRLILLAAIGFPRGSVSGMDEIPVRNAADISARAVSSGRPVKPKAGKEAARELAMPAMFRGKALGVLRMSFAPRGPFKAAELSLFSSLAAIVGQALGNASLDEANREELAHTLLLNGVALAAVGPNLKSICNRVLATIRQYMDVQVGEIRHLDRSHGTLRVVSSFGYPAETIQSIAEIPLQGDEYLVQRAAYEKRILTDTDDRLTPERKRDLSERGVLGRRYMVTAIEYGGEVGGTLALVFPGRRGPISSAELSILSSIAHTLGRAFENNDLLAYMQSELSRTQLLRMVAAIGSQEADIETIAARTLEAIRNQIGLKAGAIELLTNTSRLHLAAAYGAPESILRRMRDMPRSRQEFLMGQALVQHRALTHKEDDLTPQRLRTLHEADVEDCRYMAAPIWHAGKDVGVFSLFFEGRRDFTAAELDLFESVGRLLGQAIMRTRLTEAEKEARHRLGHELEISNIYREAALQLARSLDLKQVLDTLGKMAAGIIHGARIGLTLVEQRQQRLLFALGSGIMETSTLVNLDELDPEVIKIVNIRGPAEIDFDVASLSGQFLRRMRELKMRRALLIPIILGDGATVIISIDKPDEKYPFSVRDVEVYEGLASQAAVAIENARLHQRTLERSHSLEAILQMGSLVTSTLRLEEAVSQIIDYSLILLDMPSAMLLIFDEKTRSFRVVKSEGVRGSAAKGSIRADKVRQLGITYSRPELIEDLAAVKGVSLLRECARQGYASALISPLIIEDRLQGLLIVQDKKPLVPSEEQTVALRLFASQAANGIRNAQLYENELSIAETLQKSLLPMTVPRVRGLDVRFFYHSASRGALIGGDFYDFFEREPGRFAIVVGDVSGKGIEAATEIARVKYLLRDRASAGLSPSEIIESVNDTLYRQVLERFTALTYCEYDARAGRLSIINAGNPYPYLAAADRHIATGGILLSVKEGAVYEAARLPFQKGETLLMFTDGLTEARRRGRLFGSEGVRDYVRANARLPLASLLKGLAEEARQFSGGQLTDDVLIVGLRKR